MPLPKEITMHLRNVLRIAGVFIAAALLAGTAHAQLFRAYLSSAGNDVNDCTLPTPCRLLPAALTAVADGGEIWILDSANYNATTVNITKSVSILAVPGVLGSLEATGGGPAVAIATVGIKVALRNLMIVPGTGGTSGIVMTNGSALTVEKCLIANLAEVGIDVNAAARVLITDTTIRDNGSDGLRLRNGARGIVARATVTGNALLGGVAGILVQSEIPATTTADIAYSTIGANWPEGGVGVWANSTDALGVVSVSVGDSQVVQNSVSLAADSELGGSVSLSFSNNIITQSLFAGAFSSNPNIPASVTAVKVWASANTVSDNNYPFYNDDLAPGTFESAGNNSVNNNVNVNLGPITTIALQ
jgi:parallel beta helix pectate lyase-like protein